MDTITSLNENESLLDGQEKILVDNLIKEGQAHIFKDWPPLGERDEDKKRLLTQLTHLDASYPGGLVGYIRNAKKLLEDSKLGRNPFEGATPSVPHGEKLDYGSDLFQQLENAGVQEATQSAFVLVAGGLGERLGYSGIKVALPTDLARGACFLQVYVESILALQGKGPEGTKLPLAIMTSEDTHARTQALLQEHKNFGMEEGQITLIKQEKVPCLVDSEAHLALQQGDPFQIQTKPHGHGDIHSLLHSSGLARRWREAGLKWVCFFQDTNALVFRALPAALGVSAKYDYDMNSLAVPRKAKEAIGGIAQLVFQDGRKLTINVEYNQLDPLLRATVNPAGDVNDDSGYSPFPGNINQLVLKLSSYVEALDRTGGIIAEFVNPKYTDDTRTAFKSSTRLECMMQDFPHELPPDAKVGFTVINQVWAAYSPVKNSPADAKAKAAGGNPSHSATSGELDIYRANCEALRMLGADVANPEPRVFNDLEVELWPRVSWSPFFAVTFSDLKEKVKASGLALSSNAALVIDGQHLRIEGLRLEGALVVELAPACSLTLREAVVQNKGWRWMALNPDKPMTEEWFIRGFKVCRGETLRLQYDAPGDFVYPDVSQQAPSSAAEEQPTLEPALT